MIQKSTNSCFLTLSPKETSKLGELLAKDILSCGFKKAFILGLKGDLGGGKTTFIQGFAKGLGIKERITSPTFVIMKNYPIKRKSRYKRFFHLDCYRINNEKEILDLGFKGIISSPENIVAVEWAERIKKILPKGSLMLDFDFIDEKTREIVLKLKND